MGGDDAPSPDRAAAWRQAGALVALAALLVTLVFSTVRVWQSSQRDKPRAAWLRRLSPILREAGTLVALGALLVTLWFNIVAVRKGSQHDKDARETEQIRLLTDLNARLTDAEAKLNAEGLPQRRCQHPTTTNAQTAELRAALSYYEYLAWLYNDGKLKETNSRDFFAARLIDGKDVAQKIVDPALVDFPQLNRFAHGTRREPCS